MAYAQRETAQMTLLKIIITPFAFIAVTALALAIVLLYGIGMFHALDFSGHIKPANAPYFSQIMIGLTIVWIISSTGSFTLWIKNDWKENRNLSIGILVTFVVATILGGVVPFIYAGFIF